nr:unnamed protein product [Spirometra erinaceieuropaei]
MEQALENVTKEAEMLATVKEFMPSYVIHYQREDEEWFEYKKSDSDRVIEANSDPRTIIRNTLDPAIVARRLRIYPYSARVQQQICLRFSLYGCEFRDGIVEYSLPEGVRGVPHVSAPGESPPTGSADETVAHASEIQSNRGNLKSSRKADHPEAANSVRSDSNSDSIPFEVDEDDMPHSSTSDDDTLMKQQLQNRKQTAKSEKASSNGHRNLAFVAIQAPHHSETVVVSSGVNSNWAHNSAADQVNPSDVSTNPNWSETLKLKSAACPLPPVPSLPMPLTPITTLSTAGNNSGNPNNPYGDVQRDGTGSGRLSIYSVCM